MRCRFMLTGILLLYPEPGSVDQLMWGMIIASAYLVIHVKFQAFREVSTGRC